MFPPIINLLISQVLAVGRVTKADLLQCVEPSNIGRTMAVTVPLAPKAAAKRAKGGKSKESDIVPGVGTAGQITLQLCFMPLMTGSIRVGNMSGKALRNVEIGGGQQVRTG